MLKKVSITVLVFLIVLLSVAAFFGYTPSYIYSTPGVACGIGAKLACSSRFVSGLSDKQAFQDIVDYSPILANLKLEFNTNEQSDR